MEYIYAVMLLNKAGKDLTENSVSSVLKAAGISADSAKVKSLIAALDGVDVEKVISESSVAVAAAAPVSTGATPVAEVKKEEKKAAAPAVDAAAGLGSLF